MSDSQLSGLLQENLLTLLSFDNEKAIVIRGLVPVECFEGIYREIARGVYTYIDTQRKAPGVHLPDLFDRTLERNDRKARTYRKMMKSLHLMRKEVNGDFVMRRLGQFVRHQRLKSATMDLMEVFTKDVVDEAELDRVETILSSSLRNKIDALEPGITLGNTRLSLNFLNEDTGEVFPTGVKVLDDHGLGPRRRALHMLQGLRKAGKTHWLVNLGKNGFLAGHKVLHITLEMDEDQMALRYYQALFAFCKRPPKDGQEALWKTKFKLNEFGHLVGWKRRRLKPKFTLQDSDARAQLKKRIDRFGLKLDRIRIKSFPSGQLTVSALRAYLDRLEMQEGFIPDLLIIDYPQIMKLDTKNFRLDFGRLTVELRGICQERNMAGATVLQSNRKGEVAEDFSQTMTADTVIKYEQTEFERRSQLARLWVEAARFERDKFGILISQNYEVGQFCYESVLMSNDYEDLLAQKRHSAKSETDGDDEEESPARKTKRKATKKISKRRARKRRS